MRLKFDRLMLMLAVSLAGGVRIPAIAADQGTSAAPAASVPAQPPTASSAAGQPAPGANPNGQAGAGQTGAGQAEIRRGSQPPVVGSAPEELLTPQEQFAERTKRQQEEARQRRLKAEWEAAHRPTAWQLQNPSGEWNRYPADQTRPGYMAPNTYYGPQFRQWNQQSNPVYERQLPPNQVAVPPLPQTSAPVAPYSYWGASNQRWNMISPGGATRDPLGGWNMRSGW